MRPPGYEPGELPTAPLRDINHAFRLAIEAFLNCECKGMTFQRDHQIFPQLFFKSQQKNTLLAPHQLPKPSIFDYFPLKFEKFVVAQSVQLTQQFESFFGESTGFKQLFIILPPVEQSAVFYLFLIGQLVVCLKVTAKCFIVTQPFFFVLSSHSNLIYEV